MIVPTGMKILTVSVVFLVAMILVSVTRGPDLSRYEPLLEPRITTLPSQRMLVVEATGDPDMVGEKAFTLLFSSYFQLDDVPRGLDQPAPRIRRIRPQDRLRSEWTSFYALPVPARLTSIRERELKGYRIGVRTWEYGETAEILHVGPYDEEEPTVDRLRKYVEDRGYILTGDPEEEYLRSPVIFFESDPEKYFTIIRYRVRLAAAVEPGSAEDRPSRGEPGTGANPEFGDGQAVDDG